MGRGEGIEREAGRKEKRVLTSALVRSSGLRMKAGSAMGYGTSMMVADLRVRRKESR